MPKTAGVYPKGESQEVNMEFLFTTRHQEQMRHLVAYAMICEEMAKWSDFW